MQLYPVAKSCIGTCTQYKDNIYVFGGKIAPGAANNICERYEISSYKWYAIRPFPVATYNNTSVLYKENIFVTGYNCKTVYSYMIATDSYVDTSVGLNLSYKILCKAAGKVYLFEAQRLFEYDNDKWSNLNIPTVVPNSYLLSYMIRNEENVYFLLSDNFVYRFNIPSKKVKKLYDIVN